MISSIKFYLQAICFEAKSQFSVIVIGKVCPLAILPVLRTQFKEVLDVE